MRSFFRLLIITVSVSVLITGCAKPTTVAPPAKQEELEPVANTETIKIDAYTLKPQTAHPGSTIEISIQYSLHLPKNKSLVEVTEVRTLIMGKEHIELSRKKIIRSEGSHKSAIKFTLPMDIEKGGYTIQTVISTPTLKKTIEDTLTIKKKGR
ncbi:hypothetical protein [Candidatus Magnetominusculus xianensis]|uniref:Lipoprotein n=1 Tax=Candidatus Magnetominusculus xianensis TaxID=1748249 RepID=A0ABR5SD68_9BACT|nr:hypothetical protein [Candidatus Magnetominusculus xianensis]KWT82645.1 hypothetical protein ASN18_2437 [Candidatus Magnetominusculus xianensis]MBF0405294.1 hypothetical protein [Nitrospirota bacterium]